MFRSKASSAAFGLALLLLTPRLAEPGAAFEVGGSLEPTSRGLRVRLTLHNVGEAAAEDVRLAAELLGFRARAEVDQTIAPRATGQAILEFPEAVPVAGVHALAVRLDYGSVRDVATPVEALSQWAYLLLAFGAPPAPAVRLELPSPHLSETVEAPLTLRSADGRAHRVRLSVLVPRGLGVDPPVRDVDVPAQGVALVRARFFRNLASYRSRHGILALASTQGEEVVSTAAATGVLTVGGDPAWLPRLRSYALLAAAVLIGTSARAQRRSR